MSQFAIAWKLSRQRFVDTLDGLTHEQLNWRIFPGALTLAEAAVHVAGVETSFCSQLCDLPVEGMAARIKSAATDGVVNDRPFPFAPEELTPELVSQALAIAHELAEPVITHPTETMLKKELVSALGPVITGEGALARFAFHAAYHQGQAYLIREAPGFPK